MTSPTRWSTSILLLVTAGAHIPLVPEHLEEAPYVGWLFAVLSVTCIALAAAILVSDRPRLWILVGTICLAALLAFLASRTVGLPQLGDDVGDWTEPLGYPAVASEALVCALTLKHLHRSRTPQPSRRTSTAVVKSSPVRPA
jgi:hypothetical protein